MSRKLKLALFSIFVLAFVIRSLSIMLYPVTQRNGLGAFGDSHYYHRLAYHISQGMGYSASYDPRAYGQSFHEPVVLDPAVTRGPTYGVFLAGIYKIAGVPEKITGWARVWTTVRLVQALLGSMVCVFVALTVMRILPNGEVAAISAALIGALEPFSRYYTRAVLCESLTVFLMAAFLFCFVSTFSKTSLRWPIGAGLLLVLVVLSRAEYVLFGLLATPLLVVWAEKPRRTCLCFLGTYLLGLLAWAICNGAVSGVHSAIPRSVPGYSLFFGSFETSDNWKGWDVLPDSLDYAPDRRRELENKGRRLMEEVQAGTVSLEIDREFRDEALERIRKKPFEVATVWIRSVLWLWYLDQVQMYPEKEPDGKWMLLLLLLAALGVRHYPIRKTLPFLLPMIYLSFVLLPLLVESRYSIPLLPAVYILAGLGFYSGFIRKPPAIRSDQVEN